MPCPLQDIVYIPLQQLIDTPFTVPKHEIIINIVNIAPPTLPIIDSKATIGALASSNIVPSLPKNEESEKCSLVPLFDRLVEA